MTQHDLKATPFQAPPHWRCGSTRCFQNSWAVTAALWNDRGTGLNTLLSARTALKCHLLSFVLTEAGTMRLSYRFFMWQWSMIYDPYWPMANYLQWTHPTYLVDMYVWTFVTCTWCKLKLHWIHSAHPGSPVALVPPTCQSSRNSVETTRQFFHGMLMATILRAPWNSSQFLCSCVLVWSSQCLWGRCWHHGVNWSLQVSGRFLLVTGHTTRCAVDPNRGTTLRLAWNQKKIEEWIPLQERCLGPIVHPCWSEYPIDHIHS